MYFKHKHSNLQNEHNFRFTFLLLTIDDTHNYAVDVDHPREHY